MRRKELEGQRQSRKGFERLLSEGALRKNDSARHGAAPSRRIVYKYLWSKTIPRTQCSRDLGVGSTRHNVRPSPAGLLLEIEVASFCPRQPAKEWVSFWNHDAEMSKSNDNRVEARECIRKANRCDDSQNRWAWLVLAKSWLLLADRQEIAENGFEASGQKLTADP